jgi:NAD(P)-dependent dehydrogenase (short-subunit alcohol dehydrogenase family)
LVTGANSGLGFATTEALAQRGARVWMLCRNRERGETARQEILERLPLADVRLAELDLSSHASVRAFADVFEEPRIDVLIHNAGVLPAERQITDDGLELTLATNLVGPFLLTALLWPRMVEAERPRIVWVASGGMYGKKLDIEALTGREGAFDGVAQYAHTKRAQSVLNAQLAERFRSVGIAVHCMHPGWAETPGVQTSIPTFWRFTRQILRTREEGADTIVWLAACDKAHARSGLFWFDRAPVSVHLRKATESTPEDEFALWPLLLGWAGVADDAFGRRS